MHINELINESEVLDEITRPTQGSASYILDKAGYVRTGVGINAEVFVKPGANYVLKLFNAQDQAYKNFANMTIRHPNVHFPVFKRKIIPVNDRYYAVRMEYLTPLPKDYQGMLDVMKRYIGGWRKSDPGSDHRSMAAVDMEYVETQQPGITEACDLLADFIKSNHYALDLHVGNVMMRGNVLVIIDPVV